MSLARMPSFPTIASVLDVLPKARLAALGRAAGVRLAASATREVQVQTLADSGCLDLGGLLRALGRDELKAACRAHGLDDSGRARPELVARLLTAHGSDVEAPPAAFSPAGPPRQVPRDGDVALVRHRQYLVESVVPPDEPGHATRVALVGLDDDDQGRRLTVLWELELGARLLRPEAHGLGPVARLDPPRLFAAYLLALRWHGVTAAEGRLFQAPFRAGIQLLHHQLAPLRRALDLPRANLFIADDVGLGKTIEAGLVLQELILRQRVDFVLVLCPAALCLQWRDEMERRFGLRFEIYNRAFVARRRQERGFGINPWATHNRFVVSYQTLRLPGHREPLLQHLGEERFPKSLLVLDEAHTVAPASASRYAVDSKLTELVRHLAPRFENRLFLSATPHNGHSNSFSALLELLDPQRFTRGVPVAPRQLDRVMVRRLKSDLRRLGIKGYPERQVIQVELRAIGGVWQARERTADESGSGSPGAWREVGPALPGGPNEPAELALSRRLAAYARLLAPAARRARLVLLHLQKRLLSSIPAFAETLELHARWVGEQGREGRRLELAAEREEPSAMLAAGASEDDEDAPEEAEDERQKAEVAAGSRGLRAPDGEAARLLAEMRAIAGRARQGADAKALALLDWIRRHQCPAVGLERPAVGPAGAAGPPSRAWSERRLIVFTEYADTKRYLRQVLAAAFAGTEDAGRRIVELHGGLSDEARAEVQRAWNAPPGESPARLLLATDAAREGVNLQGACADLFHFDVPWNPARLEQRNGRIDRALQPEPVVRCRYFHLPERAEDAVLALLVAKVERIRRELGSLSAVLLERFAEVLEEGIGEGTAAALEEAERLEGRTETVAGELEAGRDDLIRLKGQIDEAGRILEASRRSLAFEPALLRQVLDAGLELAEAAPLAAAPPDPAEPGIAAFALPPLADSWQATLDTLRPPRRPDEPFWEWRRRPPQPVTFEPLARMSGERVHLHLQHPFVQRLLGRLLAQGTGAHDLARVTALRNPHGHLPLVFAFGRLCLFGSGAARLHDRLVSVAAPYFEGGGAGHLEPLGEAEERTAEAVLERLLRELGAAGTGGGGPGADLAPALAERLRAAAAGTFAALWPHVEAEAEALAHEAGRQLAERGAEESAALSRLIEEQRAAILRTLRGGAQLAFDFGAGENEKKQRDQFEDDRRHMEGRLAAIEREIETEPAQLERLYRVVLRRLEPVGLVFLWPEGRG